MPSSFAPFFQMIRDTPPSPSLLGYLEKTGDDPNFRVLLTQQGSSVLKTLLGAWPSSQMRPLLHRVVKKLMECGLDPWSHPDSHASFKIAVEQRDADLALILLQADGRPSWARVLRTRVDHFHGFLAEVCEQPALLEAMVKAGFNVNLTDDEGRSLLHYAEDVATLDRLKELKAWHRLTDFSLATPYVWRRTHNDLEGMDDALIQAWKERDLAAVDPRWVFLNLADRFPDYELLALDQQHRGLPESDEDWVLNLDGMERPLNRMDALAFGLLCNASRNTSRAGPGRLRDALTRAGGCPLESRGLVRLALMESAERNPQLSDLGCDEATLTKGLDEWWQLTRLFPQRSFIPTITLLERLPASVRAQTLAYLGQAMDFHGSWFGASRLHAQPLLNALRSKEEETFLFERIDTWDPQEQVVVLGAVLSQAPAWLEDCRPIIERLGRALEQTDGEPPAGLLRGLEPDVRRELEAVRRIATSSPSVSRKPRQRRT